MRIGIIGGGISGLSAALKLSLLKQSGREIDVTLLESTSRLGGTIDTAHIDGFDIETGTNGFLDSKPFTKEIFKDAGLTNKLVRSNDSARKRFIQKNNKLLQLPDGAVSFFLSPIISPKGKLRLAFELFVPKRDDDRDESLAEFIRRRLGSEALDFLVGPMVSGIFAGDPEKMSIAASFPVIKNLENEYGGLIRGLLSKKRSNKSVADKGVSKDKAGPSGPGGVLTSYQGGMGEAIKDLAGVVIKNGVNIKLKSPVTDITKDKNLFTVIAGGKKYIFDKLIVATPSYSSGKFLKKINNELADTLLSIPYAPIFVSGLGYNNEDIDNELDGFGYLIPATEKRDILGALFTSSMFPDQAPDGKKFLRILTGGATKAKLMEKSDAELLDISIKSVVDILGCRKDPYFKYTFRYENAIPQYIIGHVKKVERIEAICKEIGGLYIGGNVLYGIGLNDCTKRSIYITDLIKADIENMSKMKLLDKKDDKQVITSDTDKTIAAKKVTPVKKTVAAKKVAPAKKTVAAKKVTPVKKTVAVKKVTPAKKTVAAKKVTPAKKAVTVKKVTPVKKTVTVNPPASKKSIVKKDKK